MARNNLLVLIAPQGAPVLDPSVPFPFQLHPGEMLSFLTWPAMLS